MEYTTIGRINEYVSKSVNPSNSPGTKFEVYSVPSFDTSHPEYLLGSEIASNKQIVQKGDVLLCKINPRINRVWIVADETEYQSIASSEWIVIRSREYAPEFLAWYFRSTIFKKRMVSEVTGIGGSLTRAQPKRVAEYPVPKVDKDTQKQIAATLNCVDKVISTNKKKLSKLDELVKSRFVEMFGDLFCNSKHWPQAMFENICDLITDGEHTTPRRTEQGIYLLSARNIANHSLLLNDVDYIDDEEYNRIAKRIIPRENDILLSCSGSVGRCCRVPKGIKFQMVRSVALLRPSHQINPTFFEYLIQSNYLQSQIQSSATQSSQANLFQGRIQKLRGYMPPHKLQNQFAAFATQVEKSKAAVQSALDKAQLLFDSLMQKYFG